MGKSCRGVLYGLTVVLFSVCAFAEEPNLELANDYFDFGTADEGATVSHEFEIKNSGNADLRIERIVPGCRCAVPSLSSDVIKPGETAKITVELKTEGFSGKITRKIRLFSNDKEQAMSFLTMEGQVRPLVSANPAYIDFGRVVKSEEGYGKKEVTVRVREGTPAVLTKVKTFSKLLKVEELKGDEKQKSFTVALSPDAPVGELRERIIIGVHDQADSTINVPVFAVIGGALTLRPATVSLGILEGQEDIVRMVRLENRGEKPVRITDVSSSDSAVAVTHRPLKEGRRYEIEVRVNPARIEREVRAAVTVTTDSAEEPSLSFGVYGLRPTQNPAGE